MDRFLVVARAPEARKGKWMVKEIAPLRIAVRDGKPAP